MRYFARIENKLINKLYNEYLKQKLDNKFEIDFVKILYNSREFGDLFYYGNLITFFKYCLSQGFKVKDIELNLSGDIKGETHRKLTGNYRILYEYGNNKDTDKDTNEDTDEDTDKDADSVSL